MNKDTILAAIATHLETRRLASLAAVPSLASVTIRPQKSAEMLPESGSMILVAADQLEHNIGALWRLEVLRLRVQTAGLQSRDVEAHIAAMDLCNAAFPEVESPAFQDAWDAFATAIATTGATARFWFVQGQNEQPIEDNAWWEDQLAIRVGLEKAA